MTGREHLEFYARIKGVPETHIPKVVNRIILKMGLREYADRIASTYSGGNKRKLSVAIAMVGKPLIMFLDGKEEEKEEEEEEEGWMDGWMTLLGAHSSSLLPPPPCYVSHLSIPIMPLPNVDHRAFHWFGPCNPQVS